MKTLKLTLNKQWFDLIEKGIKTEEYRELKSYWVTRLLCDFSFDKSKNCIELNGGSYNPKPFKFVEFTNGYNKKSPQITLECLEIDINKGNTDWGAIENQAYFVIRLGREVGRQNC